MKKILLVIIGFCLLLTAFVTTVKADAVTDNALNFLRSKQDADGRITTGFSAPSQWSAIAFSQSGVDISTVKASNKSLLDFLLTDVPTNDAATDWETRILAIVAIGKDPTNFGGTNYVSHLETFYASNQLGDTCSLNDDIFGLLAFVAVGDSATVQIKQDTLTFLISKQDSTDGGFGFSAPGCSFYSTSADMTGAAIQALVAAKEHGMSATGLDDAITKAKNYLLANQDADGGFGYFGSSDTDTTGWVLQAFNVLAMKDSTQAQSARTYLVSQQSSTDGGIMAFDWGTSTFVSNASTTAQAVIALSGGSWVTTIFAGVTPSLSVTPTVTQTPTVTPTPTPGSSSGSSPTATPTPTNTPTPTPTPSSSTTLANVLDSSLSPTATPDESDENSVTDFSSTPTPEVLGAKDVKVAGQKNFVPVWIFAGLGIAFVFIYLAKQFIIKK